MSRLGGTVLFSVSGVVVAAVLVVLAMSEVRGELLLKMSPKAFRDAEFARFADNAGDEVYLLGTIHGGHLTTRDYSLWNVGAVVTHLHPDLLLVESRPAELARDNWGDGPVEAPFASLTARAIGVEVRGMDWWTMNAAHVIDDDNREDRMFGNIAAALPGHRKALILTGFSHVDAFQKRLLASGYHEAPFASADKEALFDARGLPARFPAGMTRVTQRRIQLDQLTLAQQTDSFWKQRLSEVIAARQALLKTIASVGEQTP
ncbi:MAG: hypothetical protein ACHP84_02065 [Caulobacterales bacterium]